MTGTPPCHWANTLGTVGEKVARDAAGPAGKEAAPGGAPSVASDARRLLQAIVDSARAVTAADAARLLLVTGGGGDSEVAATSGRSTMPAGTVRSLQSGLGGWVAMNRRQVLVSNLSDGLVRPRAALHSVTTPRGSESAVAVPILDPISGSCLGVLGALHRSPGRFSGHSLHLLRLLGEVAASAIMARARELSLSQSLVRQRLEQDRANLLSDIVETVHEGVALVDHEGDLRYANRAFAGLFGQLPAGLLGTSIDDLLLTAGGRRGRRRSRPAWRGDQMELTVRLPQGSPPRVVALSRHSFEGGVSDTPGSVVTARDVTDRAHFEARLRHQSEHDDLTGLPNRVRLQQRLSEATTDGHGAGVLAVLFIDLDGTKVVNDALGHDAGDELLRVATRRLRALVRPSDLLARYGGDELVAVIEPISELACPEVAARMLSAFAEPVEIGGQALRISASLGLTVCRPDSTPDSLLREADSAMYAAKRAGGNSWRMFEAELHNTALADLHLGAELEAALEAPHTSGLGLAYQPIWHLMEGRFTGVEALLRWNHPRLGQVPPPRVIEIAKRFHALERLTDWVLGQALEDFAAWREQGLEDLKLGVNFVPEQLTEPFFARRLLAALDHWGIPYDRMVVEITEFELREEMQSKVAHAVGELAVQGVLTALDDVGAGQSTLARLVELPIRILKVDRLFIMGLPEDQRSAAVVRAFLSVGRELHLEVVAEGVETRAQEASLRRFGCEIVQGFLYSKPLPAADCAALLGRDQDAATLPPGRRPACKTA